MAKFRRKTCIILSLFILFIFSLMMGLKMLRPNTASFGTPFGLDLLPELHPPKAPLGNKVDFQKSDRINMETNTKNFKTAGMTVRPTKTSEGNLEELPPLNYFLHAFYYSWYGNPQFDGVLALSWYPPDSSDENGEATDHLVPTILDKAHKYNLKVTFHIEPYSNRDDQNMYKNVKYIIDKYGSHPAFYRYKTRTGHSLPMFYVYDSYITKPKVWANLLTPSGSRSVRSSPYDGLFIALLVEEKHKYDILQSGFDGIYTYFATNGFTYGSSHQNWANLKSFCDKNNLIFIPSVGPGYIDTSIRPWNTQNTRNRINGKYYEVGLSAALQTHPSLISITSFNEWHEGTQIEKAVPKRTTNTVYLDYRPHKPSYYLELTRKWSEKYSKERMTYSLDQQLPAL
ncbi:glycoprotein endo-alpha-1,2-mannosidase isoform X2 [Peromyscus californicus insignis]|uniref:glycoprotein endo-alpha-1,2-mannosidase isoform X2 n=1 Tax=Peromyscus californicus insignis TaxID=564181 RepID=UPI0022A77EED|nr:glycoprotein endo-alpha-1,2-mannosidase isoform X2 [Peromyscus californicus insignis]